MSHQMKLNAETNYKIQKNERVNLHMIVPLEITDPKADTQRKQNRTEKKHCGTKHEHQIKKRKKSV